MLAYLRTACCMGCRRSPEATAHRLCAWLHHDFKRHATPEEFEMFRAAAAHHA
jgi:hypothetical protein